MTYRPEGQIGNEKHGTIGVVIVPEIARPLKIDKITLAGNYQDGKKKDGEIEDDKYVGMVELFIRSDGNGKMQ